MKVFSEVRQTSLNVFKSFKEGFFRKTFPDTELREDRKALKAWYQDQCQMLREKEKIARLERKISHRKKKVEELDKEEPSNALGSTQDYLQFEENI